MLDQGPDVFAADVESEEGTTRLVVNLGHRPWSVPPGHDLLVASEAGRPRAVDNEVLGPDCAAWFSVSSGSST